MRKISGHSDLSNNGTAAEGSPESIANSLLIPSTICPEMCLLMFVSVISVDLADS